MAAIVVRDQLRDAERASRAPADAVEPLARLIDDAAGAAAFRAQATAEPPAVPARVLSEAPRPPSAR